jgi:acyl carrier protein
MKTTKQKFKKAINKPLDCNPLMVDSARIDRLEKLVVKLADEIDFLHEYKADKARTGYAVPVEKPLVETISREVLRHRMLCIIVDKLGVEESEVVDNARLVDDLGCDSLDTVELLMEFEKEFNAAIPDERAEKVQTFGDAVDIVYDLVNRR